MSSFSREPPDRKHQFFLCAKCMRIRYGSIMCGLSGFVDFKGTTRDAGVVLRRMNQKLTHRGPDAEGYFQQGPAHLGHRRLSVIDIAASLQPMSTNDGRHTIVFNGEVYNYRALRQQLEATGQTFRTAGDTEVTLRAVAHWQDASLANLQGMFAFAVWDAETRCLFAARDHLGVKPFHYFWDGNLFAFASELKALLEHPGISREIDRDALGLFLECQYIPAPLTIYKHIRKLPAGYALRLQDGALKTWQYWNVDYSKKPDWSEAESLYLLDTELRRSVESMLVADVPLGAFLSGGVDSSVVAALMTDLTGKPIDTFNLGFQHSDKSIDTSQSEHEHAATVARHIGSRHHGLMVTPDDVLAAFEDWVDVFDEPFGDQAALPTMLLSKLTRQHVTVALTGEGADELFSGYANYAKRVKEERITSLLGHKFSPMRGLVSQMPVAWQKDRILKATGLPLAQRYATIPNLFDRATHPALFSDAFLATQKSHIADYASVFFEQCNASSYLEKIMNVDMRLWLPDDLLTKVDRATMAYSLEARVPYLDHKFVEFVAQLNPALKQHGKTTKYLLKKLAEKYLPHEIIYRSKQGFVMPLTQWLDGELKPKMEHALSVDGLDKRGLFRKGALQRVVHQHRAGRSNHTGRLWALTALELWFARYAPEFEL